MNISEYISSGVIESVILGIGSPQELAELEQLRKQYPEVETYASECEQWLLETAQQNSVEVPESGRQAFLQMISTESSTATTSHVAPVIPLTGERIEGKLKLLNKFRYTAAASVVLLLGSIFANFYFYSKYTKTKQAYEDLNAVNLQLASRSKEQELLLATMNRNTAITVSPDYTKVAMPGIAGKEQFSATVFWNKKSSAVYIVVNNLPAASAGKQYQLWAMVDGKPVDAGLLTDCNELCPGKNIPRAEAFAITLEKAGGSLQPDLQQLYVLGKVTS